jgi:hypothetical protein
MRKKLLRVVALVGLTSLLVALPVATGSVGAAPSLAPATQTATVSVGEAMTATTALVSTEIAGTKTFTITPALPAGLSINSTTGVVSGTPTVSLAATTFSIVASDGATSAMATLTLTVTEVTSQSVAVTPASQSVSGKVGTALTATTALTAPLITGTKYFSVTPKLPDGVSINTATGVISGTPLNAASSGVYIITVSDGAKYGFSTIRIVVDGPLKLTPAIQTVNGQVGKAIVETALLTSSSLAASKAFTVSPVLPSGLVLHPTKGIIYGTPTVAISSTVFTVTANDGSKTATATVTMAIATTGGTVPTSGSQSQCVAASIGGRLKQSIKSTVAQHPSATFACEVHVGVRRKGITAAVSTAGISASPDVRLYQVVASRVGGGSISKSMLAPTSAGVVRSQFTNLRRGVWTIAVKAVSATGTDLGTWTSAQFRI